MVKDAALVVVDMLYDFIDGSMACAEAETAVRKSLAWLEKNVPSVKPDDQLIEGSPVPVLFVCDSHPSDHSSFQAEGGPWPPHCVAGTHGAEIHTDLIPWVDSDMVFRKGCDRAVEQYSGFEGLNGAGQSLAEVLEILDIHTVYVCGIATEYCVRNTAEDLLKAGFEVRVLQDALGYVEYKGHLEALEAMRAEGIQLV